MGSISLREYIRWLPGEAAEPTSTVVVTSPGRRFVDIRAYRPHDATGEWPIHEEKRSWDEMDWVIAGTSSSWPIGDNDVTHGQWRHWIDSRTADAEDLMDEGDNYPNPDGTVLERGSMVNPATGKDTQYEELWRDVEPQPAASPHVRHVVLQVDRGNVKGSIVLLGQFCQGFLRRGEEMSAERWQWKTPSGWTRLLSVGEDLLPCSKAIQQTMNLGDVVESHGHSWKVIETSD